MTRNEMQERVYKKTRVRVRVGMTSNRMGGLKMG